MEYIYFKLVLANKRTIEEVPENLKDTVQAMLDEHYESNPE